MPVGHPLMSACQKSPCWTFLTASSAEHFDFIKMLLRPKSLFCQAFLRRIIGSRGGSCPPRAPPLLNLRRMMHSFLTVSHEGMPVGHPLMFLGVAKGSMKWYTLKNVEKSGADEVGKSLTKIGIRLCALVLAGVILGVLLMTAVSCLPVNRIEDHVRQSAGVMESEGEYPSLLPWVNTNLDNFTDALMLLKASYRRTEDVSPLESALMVYHMNKGPYWSSLGNVGEGPEKEGEFLSSYPRYWHGYLVFLRPALLFLNYRELRIVNLYFQVALVSLVCVIMSRRGLGRYIIPFLLLILCQSPYTTSCSLQNSTIYYLYLLASLILVAFYQKLKDAGALPYVFALIGIATAFLDFLTYPMVSFGVPVVFCMIQEKGTLKTRLKLLAGLGTAWLIGYGGMWAGKWVAASLLTENNVIRDALEAVKMRSGGSVKDREIPLWQTFACNVGQILKNPAAILVIFATAACFLRGIVKGEGKKLFTEADAVLLLAALLPLVWYSAVQNHSFVHARLFTWREILISVFALACWVRGKTDRIRQAGC
ncbi:MAG: hypothetical protein ACI4O0_02375 [Candidatus Limivicinus sp.]